MVLLIWIHTAYERFLRGPHTSEHFPIRSDPACRNGIEQIPPKSRGRKAASLPAPRLLLGTVVKTGKKGECFKVFLFSARFVLWWSKAISPPGGFFTHIPRRHSWIRYKPRRFRWPRRSWSSSWRPGASHRRTSPTTFPGYTWKCCAPSPTTRPTPAHLPEPRRSPRRTRTSP